ncbi:MAG: HpcH/HpaI aldolase/citrate lyase family protein, partial [Streptosporangiaceae bacterium]
MTVGDSALRSGPWPRSYLYCPGDRPDLLARVRSRGADAVIADLEDSVHASKKAVARAAVAAWLAHLPSALHPDPAGKGQLGEVWVRVNSGTLAEDVAAIVGPALRGIVLPKAEPALAAMLDDLLSRAERDWGLPPGSVAVQPIIETASGLLAAAELASAPRVARLGFGEVDLAGELGADIRTDPQILGPLRLQLVVASAAAGIAAPVGPAPPDFKDLAALRAGTEALLRLGFRARTAIHPAQLACINEVFTPSREQVADASRLVAALDEAAAAGVGAITGPDGTMADAATARS